MAEIRTLTAEDWPVVETNYASGIATGGATFETEPSSWEVSVVGARLLAWPRSWTFSGLANQLAIQRVRSLPITVEHPRHKPRLEKGRRLDETGRRAIAAPSPILRRAHEACSYGVQYDVRADLDHVCVALDERRGEGAGKEMAVPTMTPVELVRVPAEKSPHPGAERRLGRLDHHVDVRVHEAEGVDSPAAPFGHASKTADERKAVIVVENDAAARVSARDDVLDRARGLEHAACVTPSQSGG